jgi:hypothetical protein
VWVHHFINVYLARYDHAALVCVTRDRTINGTSSAQSAELMVPSQTAASSLMACETSCVGALALASAKIFLHTVVSTVAAPLLAPWLEHYAHLGLRLGTHAHVVVHVAKDDDAAAATAILTRFGISRAAAILRDARFNPILRMQLVNKYLAQLPADAWLINADVDEHFRFPCDVSQWLLAATKRTAKGVALCGEMYDRYARDLRLAPVAADVPLAAQFPLCVSARGGWTPRKLTKVVLVPARVGAAGPPTYFVDAHTAVVGNRSIGRRGKIGGRSFWACRRLGAFPHFARTAVQARLIEHKMQQSSAARKSYGQELATYVVDRANASNWLVDAARAFPPRAQPHARCCHTLAPLLATRATAQ